MLKILVTGVGGFVGKHLVRELHGRGHTVLGLGNAQAAHPEVADLLESYLACDLSDKTQVDALPFEGVDAVINLAGLARQGDSFKDAEHYKKVNVAVLELLGNRLIKLGTKPRLIAVSTGAVYVSQQPMPLTEASKTDMAGSPYAESKLLMETAAVALRKKGLPVVVVRPFNHIGPGQAEGFLVPDLYAKLKVFADTGQTVMVGNLKTKRDYTDVRDIARAYADLAVSETLEYDTYNICSGESHTGLDILNLLSKELDLEGKVVTEVDSSLTRHNDPAELVGSNQRLQEETGWSPTIPLEQTIADFVASKR
ncbi:MAG TPA: NAD-dependent epimerase/dehydratase family protein [Verrucomicrobiae bacterium]|nr:NAD-dependent epimerase/dehydratase family protein [Verrucomicrobiae bacterium]